MSNSPFLFGYVDPQVGSFFFQILIGGLIGGGLMCKQWWRLVKAKLTPGALNRPTDSL